jgi:hypothetical protein
MSFSQFCNSCSTVIESALGVLHTYCPMCAAPIEKQVEPVTEHIDEVASTAASIGEAVQSPDAAHIEVAAHDVGSLATTIAQLFGTSKASVVLRVVGAVAHGAAGVAHELTAAEVAQAKALGEASGASAYAAAARAGHEAEWKRNDDRK